MNYQETKQYLETAGKSGIILGLDSMRELLGRLGNPQDRLKIVHGAGTNGKGSTLAMIARILTCAGYRTGRYISPCVFNEREKIQIDGEMISENEMAELVTEIREHCQAMMEEGYAHPTVFETETVLAFLYFARKNCDFAVIECGMGGRDDATNIVTTTVVSVLTSIGMDHMKFLGNTIEEIARCKAGIIKPGRPAVLQGQSESVKQVVSEAAAKQGSELTVADPGKLRMISHDFTSVVFDYGEYHHVTVMLPGSYQAGNAATAIEAVLAVAGQGYPVSEEAIRRGLQTVAWPGRFQKIHENPLVLIDGAHNPDAAAKLAESVKMYFTNRKIVYIMGVLADKDFSQVFRIMEPFADMVYTVTPDNPRALSAESLAASIRPYHAEVQAVGSIKEALESAINRAGVNGVVLAFGSLSYLGKLADTLKEME